MNEPLKAAVLAWEHPKRGLNGAMLPNKQYWLDANPDRIPTPEEEAVLTSLGTNIPTYEWGAVAALAENIRQSAAERVLAEEAENQITRGIQFLDVGVERFLRWPFQQMHAIMGGMAPGTVHMIPCPSKGGKTTLMMSAAREWATAGKRVFYGGFELRAETLRTMLAAQDCDIDAGDVLTGAWLEWHDFTTHRQRMVEAYQSQMDPQSPYQNLRFSGFTHVDRKAIKTMMEQAHDWGADCVVIDHTDNVSGGDEKSRSIYEISVATTHLLDQMAKQYNLVVLATSQTNNDGRSRDLWRDHRPLRPEIVKNGSHKMEVATTMMGFYRPVKLGLTKEERQMVEAREKSVFEVLQPSVNAFCVMAHRGYGSRIGQVGYVGWHRGRIVEPPPSFKFALEAHQHAIRTRRGE